MRPKKSEAPMISVDALTPPGVSDRLKLEGEGSGDEVFGNRDFVGHDLDAVRRWSAASTSKTHGFAVDEQGSAPDAVRLAADQGAFEALRAERAGATDRLGPSDVEIVVRKEEVGKRPRSIRASGATSKQWSLHGRIELMVDGEARVLNLRFVEHKHNGKDRPLTGRCSLDAWDYSLTSLGQDPASSLRTSRPRTTVQW